MAHQKIIALVFAIFIIFCDCSETKRPNVPFVEDSTEVSDDVVVIVPYKESSGVRTIQVKVNDCSEFPMIFDTGCSGLLLSVAEVYVLAKQGCIDAEDIDGYCYSTIADGSIVKNMIISLKQIQIGELICQNVKACVSDNDEAPLLLGNGVLNQVESFSTDNTNKTITFHINR